MNTFTGVRHQIVCFNLVKTVAQLAQEHGLPIWTIYARYRRGDRNAELTRPKRARRARQAV